MDFLGLRTLTVIQDAVQMIGRKDTGQALDMDQIDYDDQEVLRFYRNRQDRRRVPAGKRAA